MKFDEYKLLPEYRLEILSTCDEENLPMGDERTDGTIPHLRHCYALIAQLRDRIEALEQKAKPIGIAEFTRALTERDPK